MEINLCSSVVTPRSNLSERKLKLVEFAIKAIQHMRCVRLHAFLCECETPPFEFVE